MINRLNESKINDISGGTIVGATLIRKDLLSDEEVSPCMDEEDVYYTAYQYKRQNPKAKLKLKFKENPNETTKDFLAKKRYNNSLKRAIKRAEKGLPAKEGTK